MLKKNSPKKKWLIAAGIFILVLLSAGGGYAYHLYNKTEKMVKDSQEEVDRTNQSSELREEEVDPVEDNVSMLIIGVDDSEERQLESKARSDALLLATFNKEKNNVKLLSIPRDSYVHVPEVGYNTKITHAHAYGGPESTIDTVEDFLHVPVDYYARLDFDAFMGVVDALGGLDYDVPYEIDEQDSKDHPDAIHLEPGSQTLDGEEALALARTRKYDTDVDRGKRQQEIIKKIANKATSASSVFKLNNVLDSIGPNLTTNLTFDHMKSFLSYGLEEDITIDKVNLDGKGDYMDDGGWYYVVDEDGRSDVETKLRDSLGLPEYEDSDNDNDDDSDDTDNETSEYANEP